MFNEIYIMQAMFNLFLSGKEQGFDYSACGDIYVRCVHISVTFYVPVVRLSPEVI
jgi:hypothetical protein